MKTLDEIIEQSKERFEKNIEKMVIGILSGDKKSPVFVNQELEVPRLKHIFESELIIALTSFAKGLKEDIEKVKEEVQSQTGSFKYDSCYEDCIEIINNRVQKK